MKTMNKLAVAVIAVVCPPVLVLAFGTQSNKGQSQDSGGNYESVKGLKRYYEIHGTGRPLVLLAEAAIYDLDVDAHYAQSRAAGGEIVQPIEDMVLFSSSAQPPQPRSGPLQTAQPPEVKRTVEAVVGRWSGAMTATVPGSPPETFPWSMECKAAALGAGAVCAMEGRASIGLMAYACLVAYDPEGKAVHYMCVTSMGEVHDHRGRWADAQTIEFEPLEGGLMGQRITETVTWTFPDPKATAVRTVITMPDGGAMRFEFVGRRQ